MSQTAFKNQVFANLCQGIDHLYSDGQFCDLVVTIGNDNFSCHRLVLAAVSGFFQSSLMSSWHESSTGFINIDHEDVTGKSFHLLLDILYRGQNVITMETCKILLNMSLFLRIKFLEEYCEQYFCDNMAPDNCLGLWQYAEERQLMKLAQKAMAVAESEIEDVIKCDELVHLPKAMLLILLSRQKKLNMDDLCKTVFCWAEEDVNERKQYLGDLLPFVNFTQLSSQYLYSLTRFLNHPFAKYIFHYIDEGLAYILKGIQGNDLNVKRQLKATQSVTDNIPGMRTCVVIVGGCTEKDTPIDSVAAIPIDIPIPSKVYTLKPLPELSGLDFATCVWKNELYICGGSMNGVFFAVYKPGDNEWVSLPALPQGRTKHTIAAVDWNIYVLGGLYQEDKVDKLPTKDILMYKIKAKTWSKFATLPTAVQDATAATLGHRIYVFGGQGIEGHSTDAVQCVNSITGCVYLAGNLPSPTTGARALSNGGTVFVIRPEGDVLQMKEDFTLADMMEKTFYVQNSGEADESPPPGTNAESREQKSNGHDIRDSSPTTDIPENKCQTVRFKETGTFSRRRHFSCYLHTEKVVVCGGTSDDDVMLYDMVDVHLSTAASTVSTITLPNRSAHFGLHALSIPVEFLTQDNATECPMQVGRGISEIGYYRPFMKNLPCKKVKAKSTVPGRLSLGTVKGKATEHKPKIGESVKLTQEGISSFMQVQKDYQKIYYGPPLDSIGIIIANLGNGYWRVEFPGYDAINIPNNYFQPFECKEVRKITI